MNLSEIRLNIDKIDKELQDAFIRRMELSDNVAELKIETGDVIYKPEREAEIVEKLSAEVDESIRAEYITFIRTIICTSRMYQYKKVLDVKCNGDLNQFRNLVTFSEVVNVLPEHNRTTISFGCNDSTLSFSAVMSIINDYGIEVCDIASGYTAVLGGNMYDPRIQTLCYQLMNETNDFKILGSNIA